MWLLSRPKICAANRRGVDSVRLLRKTAFMSFPQQVFRILKAVGPLLLAVTMVTTLIDQFANSQLEVLLQSDDGMGPRLWMVVGMSLMNSILFPTLLLSLMIYGSLPGEKNLRTLQAFLGRTIEQLYIETLRGWGSSIRWGLLLVIPGFIRVVQLIFIPYIVSLSAHYDQGRLDALKTSTRFTHKAIFSVLGWILLFYIAIPLMLSQVLDSSRLYSNTPLQAFLCNILDVIIAVVATSLFLGIFRGVCARQNEPLVEHP